MLSKNKIKFIHSLHRKKYRDENSLFFAEGNKLVYEILSSGFQIEILVATPDWLSNRNIPPRVEVIETDLEGMKKISALTTPTEVLAVVKKPFRSLVPLTISNDISLVLDDIRDPGNMGTIIRLCDWFGIENIICSHETVEAFNPKVVQATMGAITRVKVYYTNLIDFFSNEIKSMNIPVYGTFMEGSSIYSEDFPNSAIIVMGNEGKGISAGLVPFIHHKISIPSFAKDKGSESLNVAMATGIVLSKIRGRNP